MSISFFKLTNKHNSRKVSSAVDLKATEGKFWLYLCIFLALQERNIKRTLKSFPLPPAPVPVLNSLPKLDSHQADL